MEKNKKEHLPALKPVGENKDPEKKELTEKEDKLLRFMAKMFVQRVMNDENLSEKDDGIQHPEKDG